MRQRFEGYAAAMHEAGLEPRPMQFYCGAGKPSETEEDFDRGARLAAGYLAPLLVSPEPPDAIMCTSDGHVPTIMRAASFFGREANHDLALVGYDCYWPDIPERKWAAVRPLATIDKQNFLIGLELARVLYSRMAGELTGPAEHRKIAPKLVVLPEDAGSEDSLASPVITQS